MKNVLITLSMTLCATASIAQSTQIYPFIGDQTVELICDGNITIETSAMWHVYQTVDDTFQGEEEPGFCAYVYFDGWGWNVDLYSYAPNRPVFMEWLGEDIAIDPNQVYQIGESPWNDISGVNFSNFSSCEDGICQGSIVGIQVPDDPDDSDEDPETRWHYSEYVYAEMSGAYMMQCFPSEYFDNQVITDIILKLQPATPQMAIYELGLNQMNNTLNLDEETVNGWMQNNAIFFGGDPWGPVGLVQHSTSTFPNMTNKTYVNIYSDVDNSIQQDLVLYLQSPAALVFQPFSEIRGGLVDGTEDVYHHLNIVMDGAMVCFTEYFWEMIIHPEEELLYRSGMFDMNHNSCVRFEKDATLRIAENAHLEYGRIGEGMFALNSGCQIVMEKNASITINNIFSLWENSWEAEPSNIHIYLEEGNRFAFGQAASIKNISTDEKMKVVFHMRGGSLDLSGLDENDLKHVIIEYDQSTPNLSFDYWNCTNDRLLVVVSTPEQQELALELYSATGQLLRTRYYLSDIGQSRISLPTNGLPNSTFICVVRSSNEVVTGKVVVK